MNIVNIPSYQQSNVSHGVIPQNFVFNSYLYHRIGLKATAERITDRKDYISHADKSLIFILNKLIYFRIGLF